MNTETKVALATETEIEDYMLVNNLHALAVLDATGEPFLIGIAEDGGPFAVGIPYEGFRPDGHGGEESFTEPFTAWVGDKPDAWWPVTPLMSRLLNLGGES